LTASTVSYYDTTPTPLNQVAAISVSEARILTITPWDRTILNGISKAIQASDLGINPQNDGSAIRLVFSAAHRGKKKRNLPPDFQAWRRSEGRHPSIRRDANEKLKSQKEIRAFRRTKHSRDMEKEIQDLTDRFCKEVDKISEAKEKEIMRSESSFLRLQYGGWD
jgi:ribosome recycling factor